jgi:hypothetical protein
VRSRQLFLVWILLLISAQLVTAQSLNLPGKITAGEPFSVEIGGSGKATLYIVGLGQVIKRDVQMGQTASFETGTLHSAGLYVVTLTNDSGTESKSLEVVPATQPGDLSFLAKPSRLPVGLRNGITGAVYVFDPYKNLITQPTSINFTLSSPSGAAQNRSVTTREGAAWAQFDSTTHQGSAKFVASVGNVSTERIIGQVPGDPCSLRMSVSPTGNMIKLQTDPIRDCSGNAVPDGTIVTFTAAFNGSQSAVDVPIKRGFAEVEMPAHPGAVITVASGVVMGNQIRLGGK